MHASNSNTCHENVRFVNCLICCTLQLALQNRQYLSTEEFFSPDLVDMNHTPKSPRAKKKTKIHSMKKMEELGPTLLSHFFSARSKMSFETLFMARQERILQYHRMITLTKLFSYKFSWQKRKSCHVDMISNRHP